MRRGCFARTHPAGGLSLSICASSVYYFHARDHDADADRDSLQDHKRGVPVVRPSAHCAHQHAVPRVAASVLCAPLLDECDQPGVGHAVVMSESTWCRSRPHLKLEALPDNVRSRPPWPQKCPCPCARDVTPRGETFLLGQQVRQRGRGRKMARP